MRVAFALLVLTTGVAWSAGALADPAQGTAVARFADTPDGGGSASQAGAVPVPTAPPVAPRPTTAERSSQPSPAPVAAALAGPAPEISLPRDDDTSSSSSQWYGSETLAVDGAALGAVLVGGAFVAGGAAPGGLLALGGFVTYFVGAPVVHLTHVRVGAAFGSAGLRVGVPLVGGAVGTAFANCSDSDDGGHGGEPYGCGFGEFIAGMAVGAVGAMVLDSALLAHESAPKPRPGDVAWTLIPTADPKQRSAGIAVTASY